MRLQQQYRQKILSGIIHFWKTLNLFNVEKYLFILTPMAQKYSKTPQVSSSHNLDSETKNGRFLVFGDFITTSVMQRIDIAAGVDDAQKS